MVLMERSRHLECDQCDLQTGGGAAGNAVTVKFERKADDPTLDQALWVAIRNRTRTISFNLYRD